MDFFIRVDLHEMFNDLAITVVTKHNHKRFFRIKYCRA